MYEHRFFKKRRQKQLLIDFLIESEKSGEAADRLFEFLVEIMNAAAISGQSSYLLAKRLDLILTSERGEGRSLREMMWRLTDCYCGGMITFLAGRYPRLTKNELGICGMMVAGLEPAAICKVCRYDNEQSFYNKRADIRRKLGLVKGTSLEQYLVDICRKLRKEREKRLGELVI